jgi:4-amino-4-deoxy-L-arabinose transferase-like glycosyltransferase
MVIVLGLSLAWPLGVDLTPAASRPYVGSTVTNRVFELVAVHNGVRRLGPIAGWFGIHPKESAIAPAKPIVDNVPASVSQPPTQASIPTAGDGSGVIWPDGGVAEVGEPGPLRLFNPQLAAQASWLLPIALLALFTGIAHTSWKQPLGKEAIFYTLWAGWLAPVVFFISFGGLIHRYYLDLLAPPIAALSAAGLVSWNHDQASGPKARWLLPAAGAMTIALALFFLSYYPVMAWLAWPLLALAAIWALSSIFLRTYPGVAWGTLLAAILLCPLVWSTTPMWKGGDVILPFAGPDLVRWGGAGHVMQSYVPLTDFLVQQHGSETFLVATVNAVVAAPIQLLSRQPVMAIGGFTGADPILTVDELAQMVARGQVRFLLAYHEQPITTDKITWAAAHCPKVDFSPIPEDMDLYDCRPR